MAYLPLSPLSPPAEDAKGDGTLEMLQHAQASATRAFCETLNANAYSSPRLLRVFLDSQLAELQYPVSLHGESHSMVDIPHQSHKNSEGSFLSILCAECRYHFHIKTHETHSRTLDNVEHPSHMLIQSHTDPLGESKGCGSKHKKVLSTAHFICAVPKCYHTVSISVMPPKLTLQQIHLLNDNGRITRNLKQARTEEPQRFADIDQKWCSDSTIPTLVQYIHDRLQKRPDEVLRIKKRNRKFRVAFGNDFDDFLRSLGFEERIDDDGEECWYITAPEPDTQPFAPFTRRAHLQDTLEELRIFSPRLQTKPAWAGLMATFASALPSSQADLHSGAKIPEEDLALLGCLREFSPHWFSWAAILLASLCPKRRDELLDAGLRCIQGRSEEAALNIVVYKSNFDQKPTVNPEVQAAYDFFGEGEKDTNRILDKYQAIVSSEADDSKKTEAYQHLLVLSAHLDKDLLIDAARGVSLAEPPPPIHINGRRMSINSASQLLNVETNFTAEMIRDFAGQVDEKVDRGLIVDALKVLSEYKTGQGEPGEAQSLEETAEFIRATTGGIPPDQLDVSSNTEPSHGPEIATRFTTPPGLKNIGNTCYLNSLLQYFYNVRAVRDMVLNYDQHQLGLDEADVHNRRTGGNATPVSLEEAIVARQFIEELRRLFLELQNTIEAAANPTQKLANTALSSAKEILTAQPQTQPPPLPARPSPAPPVSTEDADAAVNVTIESIEKPDDVASSASSRTLVHETDGTTSEDIQRATMPTPESMRQLSPGNQIEAEHVEDVNMRDPTPPSTLEDKIAHISRRLEQSDRSGTSQQDVEEIIGNIMEHLMRAIRPIGPMEDKPDLQADQITQLFFTTMVNTTVRTAAEAPRDAVNSCAENILNEEVVPERWITAFPHPDKEHAIKSDLYQALDRYFSYELLAEGSLARYTTIRALPPIVHICIQRTDASGIKNKNPVIIPEELYLDRYMEAPSDSTLWRTRRRVWAIKERIKELESRVPYSADKVFKPPGTYDWDNFGADNAMETATEEKYPEPDRLPDLDSKLFQDIARPRKRSVDLAELPQDMNISPTKKRATSDQEQGEGEAAPDSFVNLLFTAGTAADEADSLELGQLEEEEETAYDDMKQYKYCLHAMICHGGGMNAGHYWVWVRDFKKQVWYKYNDSIVTEDTRDSQHVIDELNNSGDPYYVAYVRDEAKEHLVDVPQRAQFAQFGRDGAAMTNGDGSGEPMEVIDSIVIDAHPQPANSPVDSPVHDIIMQETPTEDVITLP
ncbi:cysteine proteinase [Poronia punctata]|nr:cysteine proteinase [Poronia punctata]